MLNLIGLLLLLLFLIKDRFGRRRRHGGEESMAVGDLGAVCHRVTGFCIVNRC